jgi:hypothetical protein
VGLGTAAGSPDRHPPGRTPSNSLKLGVRRDKLSSVVDSHSLHPPKEALPRLCPRTAAPAGSESPVRSINSASRLVEWHRASRSWTWRVQRGRALTRACGCLRFDPFESRCQRATPRARFGRWPGTGPDRRGVASVLPATRARQRGLRIWRAGAGSDRS